MSEEENGGVVEVFDISISVGNRSTEIVFERESP